MAKIDCYYQEQYSASWPTINLDQLSHFGEQGWELVDKTSDYKNYLCLFKRELQ